MIRVFLISILLILSGLGASADLPDEEHNILASLMAAELQNEGQPEKLDGREVILLNCDCFGVAVERVDAEEGVYVCRYPPQWEFCETAPHMGMCENEANMAFERLFLHTHSEHP